MTWHLFRTLGSFTAKDRGLQTLQMGGNKIAKPRIRAHGLLLAGVAVFLTGCVTANESAMYADQGFSLGAPTSADGASTEQSSDGFVVAALESAADGAAAMPGPSPASPDAASGMPDAAQSEITSVQALVQADTGVDALNRGITQSQAAQPVANLYSAPAPAPAPVPAQIPVPIAAAPQAEPVAVETSNSQEHQPGQPAAAPEIQELAIVAPPKKQSIFARLFAPQSKSPQKAPSRTTSRVTSPRTKQAAMTSTGDALPGVRVSDLFEANSGEEDDEGSGNIELASAAGLARIAPNGLRLQTEKVEVNCFKPELIGVLQTVERYYGRPVVVTSGYRSPKYNRRVGGASGSRHTACDAADIQVEGVSKWQLAQYLRSMPGRGGVGTYCYTESVHIDIGNARDWNWRCRRRKN